MKFSSENCVCGRHFSEPLYLQCLMSVHWSCINLFASPKGSKWFSASCMQLCAYESNRQWTAMYWKLFCSELSHLPVYFGTLGNELYPSLVITSNFHGLVSLLQGSVWVLFALSSVAVSGSICHRPAPSSWLFLLTVSDNCSNFDILSSSSVFTCSRQETASILEKRTLVTPVWLFHSECVYVITVLREHVMFICVLLMNLFYCKMDNQHWMSFAGISGYSPCVTSHISR